MASVESKGPLHTLILGKHWPEPQSSAAGSRMMQLIDVLQSLGSVSFASAAGRNPHSEDLVKRGVRESAIQINDPNFDEFISRLNPNIVIFDRFMTEEQFGWRVAKHAPQALRVLDTEDIHGLRQARYLALKEHRAMTQHDLHNDVMLRELAAIYRCDLSLVISEAEIQLLNEVIGVRGELIHYLPFMIPELKESTKNSLPKYEQRAGFITIGNILHPPNRDSIEVLHHEIWPRIRTQLPDVDMHVYGAYTDATIQKLNNPNHGFFIHGRTDDVNKVMANARVCLAPLRFGAGLKGKFFDAMQNGAPVVTTSVGAEGIAGDLPWCGMVAVDWDQFVQNAVNLYTQSVIWKTSQQNGFRILDQRFEACQYQRGFAEKLRQALNEIEENRSKNLIGSMLRHHSMKSTEYMARWIEEKNRRGSESR